MPFGLTAFNQAASVAYKNIPSNEKQSLKSSERVELMGRKDVMKEGKKIFSRIQIAVIFAVHRQINTSVVNFVPCTQNETFYNLWFCVYLAHCRSYSTCTFLIFI